MIDDKFKIQFDLNELFPYFKLEVLTDHQLNELKKLIGSEVISAKTKIINFLMASIDYKKMRGIK